LAFEVKEIKTNFFELKLPTANPPGGSLFLENSKIIIVKYLKILARGLLRLS
jgi:hypothetical protein